ncbi:hypothetical protein [Streptomyces pacificus]|uniref:Uncharacterized protein n=1 Tax=Streptomyces pacificus TaxID=2705029 RepID=A0A6A0AUI2_9ACTN|nr:hypothetical protein [Streptomyces pacificus]GFH36580.1 hypothetical protein SCWH03_28110 [Streptomyces pacificus]
MRTKALNQLAGVVCAAQAKDRTPMGIAMAIESAGMMQTPETAAEQRSKVIGEIAELLAARIPDGSRTDDWETVTGFVEELRGMAARGLGLFIGCRTALCARGEWTSKASERGWEKQGDVWLCPQCAANAADRADFLAKLALEQAPAVGEVGQGLRVVAVEESRASRAIAHFSGQPDLESTETHGPDKVTFTIRPRTVEEWNWWVAKLAVPVDTITHRGNGVATARGTWSGATVHLLVRDMPTGGAR